MTFQIGNQINKGKKNTLGYKWTPEQKSNVVLKKVKSLEGEIFGRLKVLKFYGLDKKGGSSRAVWECICSCGRLCKVKSSALKMGWTKSCGCLKSEVTRNRNFVSNPNKKGEEHYCWKGDKVGYRTLHKWVEKQLGKPMVCENCGIKNLRQRQYHWANISRNYKRITTDWRRLCVKCHKAYDSRVKSE